MAKKYYAVRKGRQTGIFNTWDECKKQVDKFQGAEFKSFLNLEEAEAFIKNGYSSISTYQEKTSIQKKSTNNSLNNLNEKNNIEINVNDLNDDEIIAYVDGSYNGSETEFSYGMVIIDSKNEYTFSKKITDAKLAEMNNVAGEIAGAMAAMKYALEHNKKKVYIYHDYTGISKWCLGEWKTNKEGTIAYKKFYDDIKEKIDIEFVKVKGHSNNKYNDMADELAKKALDIY